jgi:hypothetical protein
MNFFNRVFAHQWPMITMLCASLLYSPIQSTLATVYDSRGYRDFVADTPFYDVRITHKTNSEDGKKITIEGMAVKRRCLFLGLSSYIYDADGVGHMVYLNTNVGISSVPVGNRPPSNRIQTWGPWEIVNNVTPEPKTFEVWAQHLCSESPVPEDNLFVSGTW